MNLGDMRREVTFSTISTSTNTIGDNIETKSTFATLRAKVEPYKSQTGKLYYRRDHNENETWLLITTRYYPGITIDMSVTFNSNDYVIVDIQNSDERNKSLMIIVRRSL